MYTILLGDVVLRIIPKILPELLFYDVYMGCKTA